MKDAHCEIVCELCLKLGIKSESRIRNYLLNLFLGHWKKNLPTTINCAEGANLHQEIAQSHPTAEGAARNDTGG